MNTVLDCQVLKSAAAGSEQPARGIFPRPQGKRLSRERKTMAAMLDCYCRDHHHLAKELCSECQSLLDYATLRLERCRFGEAKPTCARCPVHCYQAQRREQIKAVMRYAGPRMLWQHPILAVWHLLDGWRSHRSIKDGSRFWAVSMRA